VRFTRTTCMYMLCTYAYDTRRTDRNDNIDANGGARRVIVWGNRNTRLICIYACVVVITRLMPFSVTRPSVCRGDGGDFTLLLRVSRDKNIPLFSYTSVAWPTRAMYCTVWKIRIQIAAACRRAFVYTRGAGAWRLRTDFWRLPLPPPFIRPGPFLCCRYGLTRVSLVFATPSRRIREASTKRRPPHSKISVLFWHPDLEQANTDSNRNIPIGISLVYC